jgi:phosphatidylglycerophosphate synthase
MQLHRIGKRAEWDQIDAGKHNNWQRLAKHTHAILTPGNVATAIGFAMVIYGSILLATQHYWASLILIGTGRLFDLADGWVADQTHTKSPLGELLDATADKLVTLATAIALFVAHIAPWWLLAALLLPHAVISVLSAIAVARGSRLHPSRVGKLSMVVTWLCLGGFILVQALDAPQRIFVAIELLAIIATAMGWYTALGYIKPDAK